MFLCKDCHKHEEEQGICTPEHFEWGLLSYGECESCGKVTDCVDCKAYKKIPLSHSTQSAENSP